MQPVMQLFLDTTDTAVLKDLAETGLVDGVTTNPTLIAKSGRNMLEVIAEICGIVEGPVSAEVAAMDVAGMLAEGRKLGVAPNVVVKVPLTREGLTATAQFTAEGIRPTSPSASRPPRPCWPPGRRDLARSSAAWTTTPNGMDLITRSGRSTTISTPSLAASIRTPAHVTEPLAGPTATIPPAFSALFKHPLTEPGSNSSWLWARPAVHPVGELEAWTGRGALSSLRRSADAALPGDNPASDRRRTAVGAGAEGGRQQFGRPGGCPPTSAARARKQLERPHAN
jgi:transaldolase